MVLAKGPQGNHETDGVVVYVNINTTIHVQAVDSRHAGRNSCGFRC